MSALIPYAASELSPVAMEIGKAVGASLGGAALKGAKNLFAHKAKTPGGRTKARMRRNKDQFTMSELGRQAGHQESKRNNRESTPTTIKNKQLYSEDLIRVEKDVSNNENITKRQRDTILHKGVKVCFSCKNIRKEAVFLNWAIVCPKAVNATSATDLLRGDDTERYLTIGTSNTFMDLRCAPINTDRYNVIMHKRYTIKPDSDKSATSTEGADLVMIEKYIKTNRQLFFNGDTATPLTNLYMVYWVDYYASPGAAQADTAECTFKFINYFKEI